MMSQENSVNINDLHAQGWMILAIAAPPAPSRVPSVSPPAPERRRSKRSVAVVPSGHDAPHRRPAKRGSCQNTISTSPRTGPDREPTPT